MAAQFPSAKRLIMIVALLPTHFFRGWGSAQALHRLAPRGVFPENTMEQGLSNPTLITQGRAVQYENGGDSWLSMWGVRPLTDGNGGGRCSTPLIAKSSVCKGQPLRERGVERCEQSRSGRERNPQVGETQAHIMLLSWCEVWNAGRTGCPSVSARKTSGDLKAREADVAALTFSL